MRMSSPLNLASGLAESRPLAVVEAVEALSVAGGTEERGAVFTKSGVVDAILDLCGYTSDEPLADLRLLEPSFGDGDFLMTAVARLCNAVEDAGTPLAEADLSHAIRAVELHRPTFHNTHQRLVALLMKRGISRKAATQLADTWLVCDDFLLADLEGEFDVVVGNPPYVRQERVPDALLLEYKWRFSTLYDRADLYVLFYERGLDLLSKGGSLGYICANRWIKNKYGGALREKIARDFHLRYFIDLERADAFHSEVIAYPAITVLERAKTGSTLVALGNKHSSLGLASVVKSLRSGTGADVSSVPQVANGRDPWLLDVPGILTTLRGPRGSIPDGRSRRVNCGDRSRKPVPTRSSLASLTNCPSKTNGSSPWSWRETVTTEASSGAVRAS